MTGPRPLVCLITPGHAASTPRLVKNADALAAAGYRVHVVAGRHFLPADEFDRTLLEHAPWSHTLVEGRKGLPVLTRKLLRRLARQVLRRGLPATVGLAARAHHSETSHLARVAARIPAQLYFGHCLAGLPAAALAARTRNVPFGFDAEDYHDGESDFPREELRARQVLQTRLLPGCSLLTAAAPLIALKYAESYGVHPITVLNVFPLAQAPAAPITPTAITPAQPARFYWFSQTVGAGRGLEAVIEIAGRMRTPVELQLRGFVSADYAEHLRALATRAGLVNPVCFLPPSPPGEMVRLAATAHLGLSTEESLPINRDLCLTNKVFAYLLAGIPQLLSTTAAQRALAPELGTAAVLADLGRTAETARELDVLFADPERLAGARHTAARLARERFCWEVEQQIFLAALRSALA